MNILKNNVVRVIVLIAVIGAIYGLYHYLSGTSSNQETPSLTTHMTDGRPIVHRIPSADGNAVIEIPEGSLPEGVSIDDLSVTKETDEDDADLVVYNLEPEGTTFLKPIRVTVTEPLPQTEDYEIPLVFHRYGEGEEERLESIETTIFSINPEAGTQSIGGELSHFSKYIHYPSDYEIRGLFRFKPTISRSEFTVGELFDFSGEIIPSKQPFRLNRQVQRGRGLVYDYVDFAVAQGSVWSVQGGLSTGFTSRLKPWTHDLPTQKNISKEQSYPFSAAFTCERAGNDMITDDNRKNLVVNYKADATYYRKHFRGQPTNEGTDTRSHKTYVNFSYRIACVDPPKTVIEEPEEEEEEMMMVPIEVAQPAFQAGQAEIGSTENEYRYADENNPETKREIPLDQQIHSVKDEVR